MFLEGLLEHACGEHLNLKIKSIDTEKSQTFFPPPHLNCDWNCGFFFCLMKLNYN